MKDKFGRELKEYDIIAVIEAGTIKLASVIEIDTKKEVLKYRVFKDNGDLHSHYGKISDTHRKVVLFKLPNVILNNEGI